MGQGLQSPANDDFERISRTVSEDVRLYGPDVQRIMDEGDLEPIAEARRTRPWFPEREFGLFVDAWLAVPLRLGSASRYLDGYTGLGGDGSEEALFGFFTTSVAALDSYSFALYSIGSMLQPRNFPTETDRDKQRITWRSTEAAYGKFFAAHSIATLLARVGRSGEYRALTNVRNVLAHRASPLFSRRRDPDEVDYTWVTRGHLGQDLQLSPALMSGELTWLRETLAVLLAATSTFVEAQWEYRRVRASTGAS